MSRASRKCTVRSTRSVCRSLISQTQLVLPLVVYNDASRRPDPSAFSKLDLWHSDVSYEMQPPSTTALKVITGPPYGGDTLWSSGSVIRYELHPVLTAVPCRYALYSSFSPQFQKYLESLYAVHSAVAQADGARAAGHTVRREPIESIHPVVRVHPATGWKSVYVNPGACTPQARPPRMLRLTCMAQASPAALWGCPRPSPMRCCTCCSINSARTQTSRCASTGSRTQSPSGTTGWVSWFRVSSPAALMGDAVMIAGHDALCHLRLLPSHTPCAARDAARRTPDLRGRLRTGRKGGERQAAGDMEAGWDQSARHHKPGKERASRLQ